MLAADLSAAAGACCKQLLLLLLCVGQWAAAAGPGSMGPRACRLHSPVVMSTLHSLTHV